MLTVYIRSVTNQPLGPLTLNGSTSGNIEFGSTTPVMLEVPLLTIPRNSGEPTPVTLFAEGYEWTIPSGWLWPDGSISNGAPRLFTARSFSGPNRISVTPPANACGGSAAPVIRVRAVDTECALGAQAGYVPTRSAEKILTVNCITPPLTIISNRTPQGGPISLFCGERLESEQVRATLGSMPSGGSFSNYNFTISGVVSAFCCLNTAAPGVYVTGTGTGSVGLSALYTRNGASTTVVAAAVVVTVRPEVAPMAFRPLAAACPGQTLRLEVVPVPGAAEYVWTVPAPFSPSGTQITPASQPYLDITSPASAVSQGFTVRVEARNGSCVPSTAQFTGVLGIGTSAAIGSDANPTRTEICPDSYVTLWPVIANIRPGFFEYSAEWTITKRDPTTGATSVYTEAGQSITVLTPPLGQWLDVEMRTVSGCGSFDPAFAAWQTTYQYQDGSYCLQVAGRAAAAPAYPNPADISLTVPLPAGATGQVRLLNSQGRPVRRAPAQSPQIVLDVRLLPDGLYYLEVPGPDGPARQQVRIQH